MVDCIQAAMAVTRRADVEKPQIEAVLPRLRHPDRIANHNILVALMPHVLEEALAVLRFPQASLFIQYFLPAQRCVAELISRVYQIGNISIAIGSG